MVQSMHVVEYNSVFQPGYNGIACVYNSSEDEVNLAKYGNFVLMSRK